MVRVQIRRTLLRALKTTNFSLLAKSLERVSCHVESPVRTFGQALKSPYLEGFIQGSLRILNNFYFGALFIVIVAFA